MSLTTSQIPEGVTYVTCLEEPVQCATPRAVEQWVLNNFLYSLRCAQTVLHQLDHCNAQDRRQDNVGESMLFNGHVLGVTVTETSEIEMRRSSKHIRLRCKKRLKPDAAPMLRDASSVNAKQF